MEIQGQINFINFLLMSVLTLIGFIVRGFMKSQNTTEELLKKHLEECNEIPKKLIVEKIEHLCEKQDIQFEHVKETLDSIKVEQGLQRQRTHNLSDSLQKFTFANSMKGELR